MSNINIRIPVNNMADDIGQGISIDTLRLKRSDLETGKPYDSAVRSHRDEGYTFHIIEKGTILIEIDFQRYSITAPAVVYMHPDQVHRILEIEDITVRSMAIKSEELNPDYLEFLEALVPSAPLTLTIETHSTVSSIFILCLKFSTEKNNKLYYPLLKDSCNTLAAYLIAQLLGRHKIETHLNRFETITRSFKKLVENNYRNSKRPNEYANKLNITTAYLNECVKNTTGFSVSQYIHNRVVLEAKRLLYHTNRSVKEIAFELGYDDQPYFSKLFSKHTGLSALSFRNKNRD